MPTIKDCYCFNGKFEGLIVPTILPTHIAISDDKRTWYSYEKRDGIYFHYAYNKLKDNYILKGDQLVPSN